MEGCDCFAGYAWFDAVGEERRVGAIACCNDEGVVGEGLYRGCGGVAEGDGAAGGVPGDSCAFDKGELVPIVLEVLWDIVEYLFGREVRLIEDGAWSCWTPEEFRVG